MDCWKLAEESEHCQAFSRAVRPTHCWCHCWRCRVKKAEKERMKGLEDPAAKEDKKKKKVGQWAGLAGCFFLPALRDGLLAMPQAPCSLDLKHPLFSLSVCPNRCAEGQEGG